MAHSGRLAGQPFHSHPALGSDEFIEHLERKYEVRLRAQGLGHPREGPASRVGHRMKALVLLLRRDQRGLKADVAGDFVALDSEARGED